MNFVPLVRPDARARAEAAEALMRRAARAELETRVRRRSAKANEGPQESVRAAERRCRPKLTRLKRTGACRRTCRAAMPSPRGSRPTSPLQRGGDPGSPGPVVPQACRGSHSSAASPPPPVAAGGSGRLRAGAMADPARPSPDGPGDGQPDLAAPLRPGDRRHAVELRPPRRAADPSRAARLARRAVRRRAAGRSRPCTG